MADAVTVLLSVIAVTGSGLIAGVFFAVAVSVLPTLLRMPMGRYVEMHRELGKGYHPAMPFIVNGAMVAELALAFLVPGAVARVLFAGAVALTLGVQAVSHLANVPINRRVMAVDPDAIPPGWPDPRPLWRSWHRLRTALAMAVVTLNAAAIALPA